MKAKTKRLLHGCIAALLVHALFDGKAARACEADPSGRAPEPRGASFGAAAATEAPSGDDALETPPSANWFMAGVRASFLVL